MPLFIGETSLESVPDKVYQFLLGLDEFKTSAKELTSKEIVSQSAEKLVYVDQREYAVGSPNDEHIQIFGTQDATTCHIMVIRHTGSGVTALAHLDGHETAAAIEEILLSVENLHSASDSDSSDGRLELHLVGGFVDPGDHSEKLTMEIFDAFIKSPKCVHLKTACIGDLNDVVSERGSHFPVIYGLGVNLKSGELYPAHFTDKGPDMLIRSGTDFIGQKKIVRVYHSGEAPGELTIDPVEWKPWGDNIDLWISLPDPYIRKYLSTSPEQEPPYFEAKCRDVMKFIRDHPDPVSTFFPGNKPRRYKKEPDGAWTKM